MVHLKQIILLTVWLVTSLARPNVLMLLADDLGYGDLSVPPFVGHGIRTPELQKMAEDSVIMTNFHDAAPICTPTRASIITGKFPWRLGIYSIYGSGPQAEEHLTVVPNAPILFLEAGYHTAHVGKWHLGGLKPRDLNARRTANKNGQSCQGIDPGPTQHGFAEYVSMEEGPGSHRLSSMIPSSTLYHQGAQFLVKNDFPLAKSYDILTDRQTDEAIRIMNETINADKNFYLHLWFDAPHGPWATISPFDKLYGSRVWEGAGSRNAKYATMVSSMDFNIGRIRRYLESVNIAENTLVVFLSDNGPEEQAGSAGPFRGRKRSLNEGGIRVPCLWQWKGRFAANRQIDNFGLSTDLFPTFLEAAGITKPETLKLDGLSLLDILMGNKTHRRGDERIVTWHKDIGGKSSAIWSHGYKIVREYSAGGSVDSSNGATAVYMFDMRNDERETKILLPSSSAAVMPTKSGDINSLSAQLPISGGNKSIHRSDPLHTTKVKKFLQDRLDLFVQQVFFLDSSAITF